MTINDDDMNDTNSIDRSSRRSLLKAIGATSGTLAVGRLSETATAYTQNVTARAEPRPRLEQPDDLPRFFDYRHRMNINGESALAVAEGEFDFDTGQLRYTGNIEEYIEGYKFEAASAVTKATTGGGPVVALQRGGQNTFSLTDGELGYTAVVVTRDEFANVQTEVSVERDGDTVVAELESTGEAQYPPLAGLAPVPMRLVQRPTDEGFTEEGTKYLRTEDGETLQSSLRTTYRGVSLPEPQVREVGLRTRSRSVNRHRVDLLLENSVSPLRESTRGLRFGGLEHTTLGEARLAASAESLVVTGEGQDEYGVSVALDGAPFLVTTPAIFDTDSLPTGASLRFEPVGRVNGEQQQLGVLSVTDRGDVAEYFCDFSRLGAETATVQVRDGGQVVTEVSGIAGPVAQVEGPIFCDPTDPIWVEDGRIMSIVDFVEPRIIRLTGGQTVIGDRLVVIPDPSPQLNIGGLSEMRVVAQNIPSFRILEQGLGMFERPHTALGDVQFEVGDEALVVNGFDGGGVKAVLNEEEEFEAIFEPFALGAGSEVTLRAAGRVDGFPDRFIGDAAVRNVDGEYVVSADFTDLDTNAVRVEVFDGEERSGEAVLEAGEIAVVPPIDIGGCGKLPPEPFPCYIIDFIEPGTFNFADGSSAEGNQLRILAAETDAEIESLSSYAVEGQGLESVAIVDEQVSNVGRPLGGM